VAHGQALLFVGQSPGALGSVMYACILQVELAFDASTRVVVNGRLGIKVGDMGALGFDKFKLEHRLISRRTAREGFVRSSSQMRAPVHMTTAQGLHKYCRGATLFEVIEPRQGRIDPPDSCGQLTALSLDRFTFALRR
jgi:hypothetical protein